MKSIKVFISLIIAASSILLISCDKKGKKSGEWAVKIDDEVITIDEFNSYYYTQNKLALNLASNEDVDRIAANPSTIRPEYRQTLIKSNFLDHLVAQKLLFKKAMNDPKLDKEELNTIIEISKLQLVGQYYLTTALKDEINITQEEIDSFHQKNRSKFRGVPINEADMQIRRYLTLQKFKIKSNEYLMGLIAESKINKEGFKNYQKRVSKEKKQPEIKDEANTEKKEEAKTEKK
jgi:hypothetical protein